MKPRERVVAALSHINPDRVALDLGSTNVTSITKPAYQKLLAYLNIECNSINIIHRTSQVVSVHEEVLERLGIDTRGIFPGYPESTPIFINGNADAYRDEWGLIWMRSQDSISYSVANSPLSGEETLESVIHYPWPDPTDPVRIRGLHDRIGEIRKSGEYAIVLSLPSDIIMKSTQLRGISDWALDITFNKKYLSSLLKQILEVQLATSQFLLKEVGDMVDVVFAFDDLGIQDRLLVSPATYDEFFEPILSAYYQGIRGWTAAKIVHHTDGAVVPILDSLIEMGVHAINPLQVSAKGMDNLEFLKAEYGGKLAFWGGIDTQRTLPFGSHAEVRGAVLTTVKKLDNNGGYVLAAVHNIQEDVPPQNILTMFETARGLL
ncbi:uroporphyrinogen decarboxylase family protein [Chloroflexota bacterium]